MSRVVVIKYSGPGAGKFYDKNIYRLMIESGLEILSGGQPLSYLKNLFPGGTIGMKANCLSRFNSTMKPLADSFGDILLDAGLADEYDLILWDRTGRELKNAGFGLNVSANGRRYIGTDAAGTGYSEEFYHSGPVSSLVSTIQTRLTDHFVNLPILKNHSIAGLSGGLKNMFGAIHNPNKYHGNSCDPYAAHINNLAPIKDKHRLTILDAVRVQYDKGPGFDSGSLAWYDGLIMSTDPVANDRVGQEILDHYRVLNDRPALNRGRAVDYLNSAREIGLGESGLLAIDLQAVTIDGSGTVVSRGRDLF